ncbi:putative aarF domain-containing protein kinase 4 [Allomyces javanicus]|nr:putative aarF domain-containing protein kinase 4 [Allomyces javanicus]
MSPTSIRAAALLRRSSLSSASPAIRAAVTGARSFHACSCHLRAADPPSAPASLSGPAAPSTMQSSAVPSTKIGRFVQYGGLAVKLGAGAIGESLSRMAGTSKPVIEGASPFLTPENVQRIVTTLTQMRGAALKLGQMISIQDSGVFPKEIEEVLVRVQNGANYMPRRQMKQVMANELGRDWQSKFQHFDPVPFAAASIGQVHRATLHDGTTVAVKVQYPGVADSIDSDLAHLRSIAILSGFLPKGLYLDNSVAVAKRELLWETDYMREAAWLAAFRAVDLPGDVFDVPRPIMDLCTPRVLTMEFVDGVPLGKVADMSQETRDWVAAHLMRLTLHELFTLGFMQTDPNWSNFLYDPHAHRLRLLDFGSTRAFGATFLQHYANVLEAAANQDAAGVMHWSEKLGFLTGYEAPAMRDAHVAAVLTLGEPFAAGQELYDFTHARDVTHKIRDLIPTMLEHRLSPPPDETYSLHRKVSGLFLLCTRLQARVPCRHLLLEAIEEFRARGETLIQLPEGVAVPSPLEEVGVTNVSA